MKLVGVDELVLEDWDVFEALTESWCEQYFAENPEQTRVHGFKTSIKVTDQIVTLGTSSPPMKSSNALTYAQTIEYYVTNENAFIDPEALVTAPFSDPFRNRAYLETLARNSSAFAGIDTQVLAIPQLPDSTVTEVMTEDTSDGSSGIIIGVVVSTAVVLMLCGFAGYRWNKSKKDQEHAPEPDVAFQDPPPSRPITGVAPAAPAAAALEPIPEVGESTFSEGP